MVRLDCGEVIFRQFSITIVSSMILSVLVALILTPALCATMLKPIHADHQKTKGFFGWFNRNFDRASKGYAGGVRGLVRRSGRMMVIYAALVAGLGYVYVQIPAAFLPQEDQGYLIEVFETA